MHLTRRRVLVGGVASLGAVVGAGYLVEQEVLPGRTTAYAWLHLNGSTGVIPDVAPGPIDQGSLDGSAWMIFNPPDQGEGSVLPVVLALHGARQDVTYLDDTLGLGQFLAASGQQFAIAAIDGEGGYWHPRHDGTDTGSLVLEEFLPMLAERGYNVTAPGFLGWSMGGYGALLLAGERADSGGEVSGVVATSPAVWPSYDEVAPGSFDDADDFEAYGMFARRDLLEGIDVRVDIGHGDPFFHNVEGLVEGTEWEVDLSAGAHNGAYWRRILPDQLDWLGARVPSAGRA